MLLLLFKAVASLSHGSSAPENGFSINKFFIGLHRNSIQADTIEALGMVQDTILAVDPYLMFLSLKAFWNL